MPSTGAVPRIYAWLTAQRNLTVFVAILVAIPTAYAFHSLVGVGRLSGDFLLLLTLAVGVPTAYDDYWPRYDRTWKAVAWVLAACAVATAEFTGLYLLGREAIGLSPLFASIGAFLVTDLGNLAWLSRRRP